MMVHSADAALADATVMRPRWSEGLATGAHRPLVMLVLALAGVEVREVQA